MWHNVLSKVEQFYRVLHDFAGTALQCYPPKDQLNIKNKEGKIRCQSEDYYT